MPSGFRVGHQPASLQAMPSRRIPAPRPGLTETLRRFSAGPGSRCKLFIPLERRHGFKGNKILGSPRPFRARVRGNRPHRRFCRPHLIFLNILSIFCRFRFIVEFPASLLPGEPSRVPES
ncbi:hypothetical protein FY044_01280 [Leclercia adecarboxylata]|nr:hypothetical protein FY044_01280 [Leclercia adecarboxylata]RFS76749.1 hypothetical protein D0U00_21880 [Leclercia adecarboxylata]